MDDKYLYCSNYNEFLLATKPILKKRLRNHLQLRETSLKRALQNTVIHLKQLGYAPFMDQTITYDHSFIDQVAIDALIDAWNGPMISKKYKEKFHDPLDPTEEMDHFKFTKNATNWVDQKSWKVSQKFFADHIEQVISYLNDCCRPTNYGRIYFAVELLSTKINGFERCREQPVIRDRTLKENCKELNNAFKLLHPEVDLDERKRLAKDERKRNPKNNTPNKQRIASKSFAQSLLTHCTSILEKERAKLGANNMNLPILDSLNEDIRDTDDVDDSSASSEQNSECNTDCCCSKHDEVTDYPGYPPVYPPVFDDYMYGNHTQDPYHVMPPNHNGYAYEPEIPPPVPQPVIRYPDPVTFDPTKGVYSPYYYEGYGSVHGGHHIESSMRRYEPYPTAYSMPGQMPWYGYI